MDGLNMFKPENPLKMDDSRVTSIYLWKPPYWSVVSCLNFAKHTEVGKDWQILAALQWKKSADMAMGAIPDTTAAGAWLAAFSVHRTYLPSFRPFGGWE